MILKNPLKQEVSIVIDGHPFSIPALKELEVSEVVATQWIKTHKFLQIGEVKAVVKEPTEPLKLVVQEVKTPVEPVTQKETKK